MNTTQFSWSAMPFLRMLIPLIIGILCYEWIAIQWIGVPISMIVLMIIYRWCYIRRLSFGNRMWYGILLQAIVVLLGYSAAAFQDQQKDHNHFSQYISDGPTSVYGVITSLKERANRYEAILCVHRISRDGTIYPVKGRLNVFIPYSMDSTLTVGLHIGAQASIIKHPTPQNPDVFNYGDYLSRQGIYHQTQSVEGFGVISKCNSAKYWMEHHRQGILKSMHRHIHSEQNYAIAASIILGYRDAVDTETKRAFAETGSIHILAVSGMHVGIIWLFASLFISRISNRRAWFKYVRVGLSVLVIWAFVFLAGLPASAVRAAWLFSLISLSQLLQGDGNLFHRLAIAATAMLFWRTNYLFDVGFQLSFSAVLGIALFLPIWDRILYFKNRVGRYLWGGVGMTIGATLGTLPLSMYYFQYFPITGLISGVIVVLFATLILGGGILFLITYWLALVTSVAEPFMLFFGKVLNFILSGLCAVVEWFHAIPNGMIEGISLSVTAVLLIYILLISLRRLWTVRNKWLIYSVACSALLLSSLALMRTVQDQRIKELVIYHDYRNNSIELFDGQQSLLISDDIIGNYQSNFLNKGKRIRNQVSQSRNILNSDSVASNTYYYNNGVLKYYDKELLIVSSMADIIDRPDIHWDYILLVDNANVSIDQLYNELRFDKIIIAASNWSNQIENWKKACNNLQIPYIDIKNSKALTINVLEKKT